MEAEKIKFYLKNGDDFRGETETTHLKLIKELKQRGYTKYYGGVCDYDGISTIVGIDENNKVDLKQREENGLIGAYESKI